MFRHNIVELAPKKKEIIKSLLKITYKGND